MSAVARRAVAVAVLGAVLALPASASGGGSYDLLKLFKTQIASVKEKSEVPVLLPRFLPVAGKAVKAYASGKATREGWQLSLAGAKRCNGADACFLAQFDARRGGHIPGRPNVRLATGDEALYLPLSCGASCAPAELLFRHAGVLYTWQVKDAPPRTKATLARLAVEAIRAGPR